MLKVTATRVLPRPGTLTSFMPLRALATSAPLLVGRQQRGGRRKSKLPFDADNLGSEPFSFDDQTTVGHELYENIREVRKYLRKAKYEIPQLSQYAEPFVPPSPTQILRFKSHNYMGEPHPVERKVVMTVTVADLALNKTERHKLLLLCGPRYNPERDELKFSCEKFPFQAQNKKYLSDLLDRLLEEAKDPKETFADIPLDTRYYKPKKRLEFPAEWIRPKVAPEAPSPVLEESLLTETEVEAGTTVPA